MSKYLVRANYVGDGVAGLLAEGGTKRTEAAQAALASVGGTIDCMYFAFGDTDVFAIADIPDQASAVAVSLLINATGSVSVELTPLMTAADVDEAVKKSPTYTPPGT